MRRHAAAIPLAAALLLAAAGCGGNSSTARPPPPRRASPTRSPPASSRSSTWPRSTSASRRASSASRNIDLTLQTSQGGAAIVPGVVSGQFQFGFSNVDLAAAGPVQGPADQGRQQRRRLHRQRRQADFGGVRRQGPTARSPVREGPRGQEGRHQHAEEHRATPRCARRSRKAGGDPTTVKFVELAFPDMPAALDAGRVDAICVVEPFLTAAKAQGCPADRLQLRRRRPEPTVATYFTSQELDRREPRPGQAVHRGDGESLAYADAHPDEVRAILGTYTQITADVPRSSTLPKWPAEINTDVGADPRPTSPSQDELLAKRCLEPAPVTLGHGA